MKNSIENYVDYEAKDVLNIFFIISCKSFKVSWCPAPNCRYAYINPEILHSKFDCPLCEKNFCLECRVEYHKGLTCEEFQQINPKDKEVF